MLHSFCRDVVTSIGGRFWDACFRKVDELNKKLMKFLTDKMNLNFQKFNRQNKFEFSKI